MESIQTGSARQSRAQTFWAAAALAYLLLTLGFPVHAFAAPRCEAPAARIDASIDEQALRIGRQGLAGPRPIAGPHDDEGRAFNEMVFGRQASPLRWERTPELVVLTSVMQYEQHRGTQYRATAQRLSQDEADALVADLTDALAMLTDHVFQGFAAVRRESAAPGDVVDVMRPGQIVVARYAGVRDQLGTIGFGGRATRSDEIRAGSIILDSDFDRTSPSRRLLRAHELGHALGYNHVHSRVSIMNPQIGSEPTEFDRAAARAVFHHAVSASSSCS
ncbi:MAG TPA: hypothetical protein VFZ73_07980 [Gemmatimonadaceae bacterium]